MEWHKRVWPEQPMNKTHTMLRELLLLRALSELVEVDGWIQPG